MTATRRTSRSATLVIRRRVTRSVPWLRLLLCRIVQVMLCSYPLALLCETAEPELLEIVVAVGGPALDAEVGGGVSQVRRAGGAEPPAVRRPPGRRLVQRRDPLHHAGAILLPLLGTSATTHPHPQLANNSVCDILTIANGVQVGAYPFEDPQYPNNDIRTFQVSAWCVMLLCLGMHTTWTDP